MGAPTDSESESDQGENDHATKAKTKSKLSPKKSKGKAPTVVSSESDLDDDELGITPSTPPESPFYRGLPSRLATVGKTTNAGPSKTTTLEKKHCKKKDKEVFATLAPPEQSEEPSKKKKKGENCSLFTRPGGRPRQTVWRVKQNRLKKPSEHCFSTSC